MLWEVGPPGISGKSVPVLSPSPLKRFIEDCSEIWVGSMLVLFLDMGHSEKVSPRAAWMSLCTPAPSAEKKNTREWRWDLQVRQENRSHYLLH